MTSFTHRLQTSFTLFAFCEGVRDGLGFYRCPNSNHQRDPDRIDALNVVILCAHFVA